MAYVVYYTTVSSSNEIKKQQTKVFDWLDSKKVEYQKKDVSVDPTLLKEMRDKAVNCPNKEKALPPQIFKEDTHLGGYENIANAVEDERLSGFLELVEGEDPCQQMQQAAQQP